MFKATDATRSGWAFAASPRVNERRAALGGGRPPSMRPSQVMPRGPEREGPSPAGRVQLFRAPSATHW